MEASGSGGSPDTRMLGGVTARGITNGYLMAAAELYLCLSKALAPPLQGAALDELRDGMLVDLQELCPDLPAIDQGLLDTLAEELAKIPSAQRLLVGYSKLYLTPPAPAPLNLGFYLDGAANGHTADTLEALYRRQQLGKDPAFHDLWDHLALNLQCVAWMLSRMIDEQGQTDGEVVWDSARRALASELCGMLSGYSLPGVRGLRQRMGENADRSVPEQRIWHALTELTLRQLGCDQAWLEEQTGQWRGAAAPPAGVRTGTADSLADGISGRNSDYGSAVVESQPLSCRGCGSEFIPDATLAEMRVRLEAAGLSAAHLAVCPRCRGGNTAAAPVPAPGAGRKHGPL